MATEEEELQDAISDFYADPLGFVIFAFPWDTNIDIQQVKLPEKYRERYPNIEYGPDEWACEFLDQLGEEIRKRGFTGQGSVDPIRFATASGHGIGKTTISAWIILFLMSTRPDCKGTVTAGTADQLSSKTGAELGKWHELAINKHWFQYNTGRGAMSFKSVERPVTWICEGRTCRKEEAQSFAGQHAPNASSFYLFDEASIVPVEVYEVREGGLSDGEPMAFDFGNPTELSGPFFDRCKGKLSGRYIVREIDSRDVAITNKKLFAEWIEDYGIDSDFVKVRVLGQFPNMGSLQYIPLNIVEDAMSKRLVEDITAPIVIGVDVARFGDDDSVIFIRKGRDCRSWKYKRFSGADTVQLTGHVIQVVRDFAALNQPVSAVFVDGTGVGGGVVDNLNTLGYDVIEVNFGASPIDKIAYKRKGDECWGRAKKAMEKGQVCLPNDSKLKDELTQRQFGYTPSLQVQLESKTDMKARGLKSPDLADAYVLTHTQDVAHKLPPKPPPMEMDGILAFRPVGDKLDTYHPIRDYKH